ncbi:MAG TPA: AMP-binding protein [Rubrivivax sp.]|jgi:long-chain acyl-CoA synthetase|nr:AMP-binding protein [Rubrivivax sp.]
MSTQITPDDLPLQRAYRWEKERADTIFLTQPMGGGVVRDWTWSQAMDEARRVAAWLKAQGWEPGSRVAIMSKNTAWWIMSDLAVWMAGYVSVPIYPNLVAETVKQILEHSETRLCVVGKLDDTKSMLPGIPAGMPCITTPLSEAKGVQFTAWDDIVRKSSPLADGPTPGADAMSTIIYTSGTTGMPKGAVHGFGAFAHTAKALAALTPISKDERALSYLPLAHVAERCLIEGAGIWLGSRIYFAESLDTFLADLQRARPTYFFSVPRLWVKFQQGVFAKMPPAKLDRLMGIPILGGIVKKKILKQLGLDSVRFAGTGAAPLPPEVMTWYRKLGLELLEGYGMTEQFALATSNRPGQSRIGYVGNPSACCEVRLSDSGEVLTRGPAHMQGYFKEPEKTRETMTDDGWLKTGDLGQFDEQGRLKIVGRAKEQFKTSKGKYVAPAPIESKLSAFTRIEACMVSGVAFPQPFAIAMLPAGQWQALQAAEPRKAFADELAAHVSAVNEQLDPHERLDFVAVVPEQWTVEAGFVTPTLKLKRNVLETHYGRHFEVWAKSRQTVVWHQA